MGGSSSLPRGIPTGRGGRNTPSPQWIFVTGYTNDLLLIRKQMTDQQIKASVVSMIAGPAYQEFIDAAGPGGENGERCIDKVAG